MATYISPLTFNFVTSQIIVDAGVVDIECIALYTAIKEAQASEEGIIYDQIAKGSGLVDLGPGVSVGITVELLGSWQLKFAEGNYIARLSGGNLVGGSGGDPIAYSAGVQTLWIMAAASTVVDSTATDPWNTLIDEDMSAKKILSTLLAYAAGLTEITQTADGEATVKFKGRDGTTDRITAEVINSERKTITLNP